MGNMLIINGSPRAPKSNSKQYIELFQMYSKQPGTRVSITPKNHRDIWDSADNVSDILFVFPLYADGIPSTLLNFLKSYDAFPYRYTAAVHMIVNCGFLEPEQNAVAVKMMQLFCKENGFSFGSSLCIGSGEAILGTPFRFLVKRKIKKLARAIDSRQTKNLSVTMPLSPKTFVKASTNYWINLAKQNDVTPEEMATMDIEN